MNSRGFEACEVYGLKETGHIWPSLSQCRLSKVVDILCIG